MRFYENSVAAETFIRRAHAANEGLNPRAPGMHATDLIFCQRKAWYRLNLPVKPEPSLREMSLWLTGHGHHQILQCQTGHGQADLQETISLTCPDLGCSHPVIANLDFMESGEGVIFPVEIKSTRKSAKAENLTPVGLDYYLEQLILYMLRWGRLVLSEDPNHPDVMGRLYILFLMGDYSANRTPVFMAWDVIVTLNELRAWQAELAGRAHRLEKSKIPPVPERYAWECSYCPYAGNPCDWPERSKGRDGDKTGIRQSMFFSLDPDPDTQPTIPEDGDHVRS